MIYALAIVSLLAAAGSQQLQASALTIRNYAGPRVLLARQVNPDDPSSYPVQCQPACTPLAELFSACDSLTCLCTNANGQIVEKCVDCLVDIAPIATVISAGESDINEFNSECAAAGINIISLSTSDGGPTTTAPAIASSNSIPLGTSTTPLATFNTETTPVATSPVSSTTSTTGSGSSVSPLTKSAAAGRNVGLGVVGVVWVGLVSVMVLVLVL